MKKNGFMEGAFIATLAIIVTKILGVVYVIPFYSIIGEQGGSLYGYAYNIYNFFLIISSAGIPLAISKITSEYQTLNKIDEKEYMYSFAKKAIRIFSIVSFLICFFCAKPLANLILGDLTGGNTIEDVTFVIRCVSFALLVVPLLSIYRGYLQGHKYITAPSISQVIEQVFRVLVILLGSFLALKVFHLSITNAVGIAVFGAFVGAFVAYFYLINKTKKIAHDKENNNLNKKDKKEVIHKLISYAIPFIVINVCNSLYNSVDMVLVIRGLTNIGYPAADIETISAVFTTWGSKIVSIVTAIATGFVVSLIPSIVSSYTKEDYKEVNNQFNKTLQTLLYIILPLTIFISIFANNVWTIFYGDSFYGPLILKYSIIVAFLDCAYLMICCALQGLNKTKLIYISVITGLSLNAILDLPLMYLFNNLNIYPFYGAILATFIGYVVSLSITLITLKKKYHFNYKATLKSIPQLILSLLIMIMMALSIKMIIQNIHGRVLNLLVMALVGLFSLFIYYLINSNLLKSLLGENFFKKLFRKDKNETN